MVVDIGLRSSFRFPSASWRPTHRSCELIFDHRRPTKARATLYQVAAKSLLLDSLLYNNKRVRTVKGALRSENGCQFCPSILLNKGD